jgi:hypothetical protein
MAALGTGLSAAQIRALSKSRGAAVSAPATPAGSNSTADLLIRMGAKE